MILNKCDYCKNRDGNCRKNCKNNVPIAGREKIIQALEEAGYKYHCKILNVVQASEIVLFKDLARVKGVPNKYANAVTTNSELADLMREHTPVKELMFAISKYIPDARTIFAPMIDDIEPYCYGYSDMVYGQSIHASGTILSKEPIKMAISEDTACANGHYCEELGYIKYDLLSLANLDPIEEILGIYIDWNNYDKKSLEYIVNGNMDFVFQFGSKVVDDMIHGIPKESIVGETEADRIDAVRKLAEITSINRPGALSMNLNKTWVDIENFSEKSPEYKLEQMVTDNLKELKEMGLLKQ